MGIRTVSVLRNTGVYIIEPQGRVSYCIQYFFAGEYTVRPVCLSD